MNHISEGDLRHLRDDVVSAPQGAVDHYRACAICQERMRAVAETGAFASAALSVPAPSLDPTKALSALSARSNNKLAGPPAWRRLWDRRNRPGSGRPRTLASAGVAVALILGLTVSPAGSLAQNFLNIFQPNQVAALPVNISDLQSLPQLRHYGTITGQPPQITRATNPQQASQLSGLIAPSVSPIPAGIPSQPTYEALSPSTSTFTFSALKARKFAASIGKQLARLPAGLDGSSLTLTTGEGVVEVYGDASASIPSLAIGEMKVPHVSSTGVSLRRLEKFLLNLPGVSPQLRRELQSIGSPTTTLPIPVPIELATAQNVTVQGVHGLAIGDNTGVGSGVVWVKDGLIHGVAGALAEDKVLAIANSL